MGLYLAGRPALLLVVVPLVFGCAANPVMPEPELASLGKVALQVTGETQFRFGSVAQSEEGDRATALASSGLGCAGMGAAMVVANPLTAPALIIVLPACAIASLASAGLAVEVESGTTQRGVGQSAGDVVATVPFSRVIEAEALEYARKAGVNLPVFVDGDTLPPDSLLEIAVPNVFVVTDGRTPLYLVPRIEATVRVLRVHDHAVLDSFQIGLWGEPRLAEEMLSDEGLLLRETIRKLVAEVAERAVDEVLVVVRSAPGEASDGPRSRVPDYALQPVQPPLKVRYFSLGQPEYGGLYPIPITTLQPEFVWAARTRALGLLPETAITYDLRVYAEPRSFDPDLVQHLTGWVSTGSAWDLLNLLGSSSIPAGIRESPSYLPNGIAPVYERFGLIEPQHRLEVPLEACRKYRWTVRARWATAQRVSATEWAGGWIAFGFMLDPRWQRRGIDMVGLARVEDSPLLFYAPFVTPAVDGRACADE